jgi:U3 small nucleolar RNA-associated protein 20
MINIIISAGPNNNDSEDDSSGPLSNSSFILGTCMHVLATRDVGEWSGPIDVGTWTLQAADNWARSSDVLGGLLALAQARFEFDLNFIGQKKTDYCIDSPLHLTPVSLDAIYPSLCASLLSPSRSLRLNTLRFLDSKKLIDKNCQDPGVAAVLKRCLQGEEVSLDLQGVRERVLRIGRVGQVVGGVRGAEVCARWLIG